MSQANDAGRPPRHDAQDKYDRILSAALEVFACHGFHEAKVTQIAQAAGVADGTIYLYFKNKEDLLVSLFDAKLRAINQGLTTCLQGIEQPLTKLECFVRYHLSLAQDDYLLAAFITIELRRSARFMKENPKERLMEYLGRLGEIIDQGKAAGVFRDELRTGILKHIIFGALDHACQIWAANPQRKTEDLDEVGDQLIDMVRRSILCPTV